MHWKKNSFKIGYLLSALALPFLMQDMRDPKKGPRGRHVEDQAPMLEAVARNGAPYENSRIGR